MRCESYEECALWKADNIRCDVTLVDALCYPDERPLLWFEVTRCHSHDPQLQLSDLPQVKKVQAVNIPGIHETDERD